MRIVPAPRVRIVPDYGFHWPGFGGMDGLGRPTGGGRRWRGTDWMRYEPSALVARMLAAATCAAILGACTETAGLPLERTPPPVQADAYRLGPGDVLRVGVYLEPDLSGDFAVQDDGTIAYPLLGAEPVAGRTLSEVRAAIAARLRGRFVGDPRVTVGVATYRPFFVLGEVGTPGRFAFEPGLTLDAAVATAGGYNFRADRRRLILQRGGGGPARRFEVAPGSRVPVQPGDVVTIPRRYF